MKYKVGIVSLGCAKNRVDAEMLLAKLNKQDFTLVEDVAMADAAIINTCAFIESAKKESIEEILELAKADEKVANAVNGMNIIKEIVVPKKLVNIVVKP